MAAMLLIVSGCASYSQSFQDVEHKLLNNDPAGALQVLDKQSHRDKDQFLYASNKAMLLRMLDRFSESNAEIEKSKAIIEQYSATSLTEVSSSFIINDATSTYIGTPVEQVMLHIYSALNYLETNDLDSARVEILQADIRLRTLMQDDPDNPLSTDPFAHYMSGIIYEDLSEWSDAMIAYRKAYNAYQIHASLYAIAVPQQLKRALILMADKVGLTDERQKYEAEFQLQLADIKNDTPDNAELVFIFNNGLAPIKRESSVSILEPQSGHMVRVSLPRYEKRNLLVASARLLLKNDQELFTITEKVEDISSLEIKTLESQMGAITARALARMMAKHKMSDEAGKQNGWAGLVVNIAGVLTERADTRSWLTLPAEIQTARLHAPAASYSVTIELLDYNNNVILQRSLKSIEMLKGRKHYLSFHWMPASTTARH